MGEPGPNGRPRTSACANGILDMRAINSSRPSIAVLDFAGSRALAEVRLDFLITSLLRVTTRQDFCSGDDTMIATHTQTLPANVAQLVVKVETDIPLLPGGLGG
jgi:hypothetical protein